MSLAKKNLRAMGIYSPEYYQHARVKDFALFLLVITLLIVGAGI